MRRSRIRRPCATGRSRVARWPWYGPGRRKKAEGTKCYRIYRRAVCFCTAANGGLVVGCLTLNRSRQRNAKFVARSRGLQLCGRDAIFHSMKRNRFAPALPALFGLFCAGLLGPGWGQTPLPPVPPPPMQGATPLAPAGEEAPEAPRADSPQRDFPRSGWRNLSPAQREAIRRLSREEREALLKRGGPRQGGGAPPGMRLSPQERRQLREQIREEHERRGGGFGRGRRP